MLIVRHLAVVQDKAQGSEGGEGRGEEVDDEGFLGEEFEGEPIVGEGFNGGARRGGAR